MSNIYGVCYTTKEPIVYNKGTQWEKACSDFLFMQAHKVYCTKLVYKLNTMLAEGVEKYELLDMTKIDHFYLDKSEEMY